MTDIATLRPASRSGAGRQLLNKVPEVTVWFWVIKILCTTVGESFADYINETLGFGLTNTTILFTAIFVVILGVQMRLRRYVAGPYWLTVVVVSVAGTLYTDILTDAKGVPLGISTTVFSVLLAVTFGVWWLRERTLSIHSITTTPRESFYWLTVLVTFALGTATGDWTLQLTGWGPGVSILLPAALIAVVAIVWRSGGNPVLTFWVAYILTRPLGANIGDFLSSPRSEKGLGMGTLVTSLVFLGAILATVVYLTITRRDVIEEHEAHAAAEARAHRAAHRDLLRERVGLAVLGAAALATGALLTWANAQPHADALAAEEGAAPTCSSGTPLTGATAPAAVKASFPAAKVAGYRSIVQDTTALVAKGDQPGAARRITDLETAWDHDQDALQPKDCQAWTYVDGQIDDVLSSVRASSPHPSNEEQAMQSLLATLG